MSTEKTELEKISDGENQTPQAFTFSRYVSSEIQDFIRTMSAIGSTILFFITVIGAIADLPFYVLLSLVMVFLTCLVIFTLAWYSGRGRELLTTSENQLSILLNNRQALKSANGVKLLESEEQIKEKPLDIAIEKVFQIMPKANWNDITTTFVTVVLKVGNKKSENNTIHKSQLFVTDRNLKEKEGELLEILYLVKFTENPYPHFNQGEPYSDVVKGNAETVKFSQGIYKEFAVTFKYNYLANPFEDGEHILDMSFVIKLEDFYGNVYEKTGIVPRKVYFL